MNRIQQIQRLSDEWSTNKRWEGVVRQYLPEAVLRLRGTVQIEYTLARRGAERLWDVFHRFPYVRALGAMSGNQAIQQVQAGLPVIYVSGWQVAADANNAGQMYPDLSLYPADSVPGIVRRINNAFRRADQIQNLEHHHEIDWFAPLIADAEAGFGGPLNTFEIMQAMIEAGAAGVHLEDQVASLKKCGHLGGKVLVSTGEFLQKLTAARLAADTLGVPTVLIARTDANGARLILNDADPIDQPFLTGRRTTEGYFVVNGGLPYAIARALSYAPYADMLWCETSTPDLAEAKEFADAVHEKFPEKLLAYNCSPSFNWKRSLDERTIARFQDELASMGYTFQFVTLAGFHSLNSGMFELAQMYRREGMTAYARLQEREFALERQYGFNAVKHQRFVGTSYFDEIQLTVSGGRTSTTALDSSTEAEQFV